MWSIPSFFAKTDVAWAKSVTQNDKFGIPVHSNRLFDKACNISYSLRAIYWHTPSPNFTIHTTIVHKTIVINLCPIIPAGSDCHNELSILKFTAANLPSGESRYAEAWQPWFNNPTGEGALTQPEEPPAGPMQQMDLYKQIQGTSTVGRKYHDGK